jgi:hypothetical protein
MATTTKAEIERWFDTGLKVGSTHMIVVCDMFDCEDYPVYADNDEQARKVFDAHNEQHMQRVMEVYDLRLARAMQMNETRAFHLPPQQPRVR